MAKISSYPVNININMNDILIGSDVNKETKNFKIEDLLKYLTSTLKFSDYTIYENREKFNEDLEDGEVKKGSLYFIVSENSLFLHNSDSKEYSIESNLFIKLNEQEALTFSSDYNVKTGSLFYLVEEGVYKKFNGESLLVDPFPTKLDIPTETVDTETTPVDVVVISEDNKSYKLPLSELSGDYIPLGGTEEDKPLSGTIVANIEDDISKPILYAERVYSPIVFAEHLDAGYGFKNTFSASRDGVLLESMNTNTSKRARFILSDYTTVITGTEKVDLGSVVAYGDGLVDAPNLTDDLIDTSETALVTRRYLETHSGGDNDNFVLKSETNSVKEEFAITNEDFNNPNSFYFGPSGLQFTDGQNSDNYSTFSKDQLTIGGFGGSAYFNNQGLQFSYPVNEGTSVNGFQLNRNGYRISERIGEEGSTQRNINYVFSVDGIEADENGAIVLPKVAQEFVKNGLGWALKYKVDNPDKYVQTGENAVDLTKAYANSTINYGASGKDSFTAGAYNLAAGLSSVSIGYNTKAYGTIGFAIGYQNTTYSAFAGIFGGSSNEIGTSAEITNPVSGLNNRAFIFGGSTNKILNGSYSTIVGGANNTITLGGYSSIYGGGLNVINTVVGSNYNNILGGYNNQVITNSSTSVIVGGQLNITQGLNQFVTGLGNRTVTNGETIVGTYATLQDTTLSPVEFGFNHRLFAVGIGEEINGGVSRADGLEVFRNGIVTAPQAIIERINLNPKALITKEYLERYNNKVINIENNDFVLSAEDLSLQKTIVYFNLNTEGSITLPITGIKEGQEMTIINTTNETLTVISIGLEQENLQITGRSIGLVFVNNVWIRVF